MRQLPKLWGYVASRAAKELGATNVQITWKSESGPPTVEPEYLTGAAAVVATDRVIQEWKNDLEDAARILRQVEWKGVEGDDLVACPCCAGTHIEGHRKGCELAAFLKRAKEGT